MATRTYNDLSLIVAVDETGGYAKGKVIPWSFKEDWKHFQATTKNHVCIMGRGTYEDILARKKKETELLLPKRESYVISTSLTEAKGATVVSSIQTALDSLPSDEKREIFILGGRRLFVETISQAKQVWLTIVPGSYDTNKKFPIQELSKLYTIVEGREESGLKFIRYVRKVDYYTVVPNRIPQQQLIDHFQMTNRFVKVDEKGAVVFVRPREDELYYLQPTVRHGLAIENEASTTI